MDCSFFILTENLPFVNGREVFLCSALTNRAEECIIRIEKEAVRTAASDWFNQFAMKKPHVSLAGAVISFYYLKKLHIILSLTQERKRK